MTIQVMDAVWGRRHLRLFAVFILLWFLHGQGQGQVPG